MWWILVCGVACDVDAQRTERWRYEAEIARFWSDEHVSRAVRSAAARGYRSHEQCLEAVETARTPTDETRRAGGGHVFVSRAEDIVHVYDGVTGVELTYACFRR
jgi:hypothetical protein